MIGKFQILPAYIQHIPTFPASFCLSYTATQCSTCPIVMQFVTIPGWNLNVIQIFMFT